METEYRFKGYKMTAQESNDALTVYKSDESDWCTLTMNTNEEQNGQIVLRSKEMAAQLHFMLGRMLGQ